MSSRNIYKALEVPDFRWLWVGSLASSFAMNMQIIARGWLVYTLTSSALDLAWVTFVDVPSVGAGSPSKLFDALATSCPVVVTNPGWMKELVDTHRCGWFSPPENASALADLIRDLSSRPSDVREFIQAVSSDPGIRWGGEFSQEDPVHLDDGLNLSDPVRWWLHSAGSQADVAHASPKWQFWR